MERAQDRLLEAAKAGHWYLVRRVLGDGADCSPELLKYLLDIAEGKARANRKPRLRVQDELRFLSMAAEVKRLERNGWTKRAAAVAEVARLRGRSPRLVWKALAYDKKLDEGLADNWRYLKFDAFRLDGKARAALDWIRRNPKRFQRRALALSRLARRAGCTRVVIRVQPVLLALRDTRAPYLATSLARLRGTHGLRFHHYKTRVRNHRGG
jgi:hypothetical protein